MIRFWYPDREVEALKDELDPEIKRVRYAGDFILRKDVEDFETNFAEFVGTKYAVAVASGTDALILSLKAFEIGPGDEVILPAYTFRATLEAIHHVGATPVLADVGEDWRKYRTPNTKAIIPVHMEGQLLSWTPNDLLMFEDACQAIGAGPVTGNTACYSFYPAKILGSEGDGGAIATNNEQLAIKLRKMRNHYKDAWEEGYGFNSRLDNVQAAILNVKLKHLPEYLARRKEIAMKYHYGLPKEIIPPKRDVYQDYIVNVLLPIPLQSFLAERGIQTMLNEYPFPISKPQKATTYEHTTLRLPCTPYHTDNEIDQVIAAINEFYSYD